MLACALRKPHAREKELHQSSNKTTCRRQQLPLSLSISRSLTGEGHAVGNGTRGRGGGSEKGKSTVQQR